MCLAIPGKVIEISGDDLLTRSGRVDFGGVIRQVNLCYVPDVKLGDYVVVHVGFALSILDESEANKIFEYLREMESLAELEEDQP